MENRQASRIAILSDQAITLRGLVAIVMGLPTYQLVGVARSLAEGRELCRVTSPEMLLVDLKDTREHGRAALLTICEHRPDLKVMLILEGMEEEIIPPAMADLPVYCLSRYLSEEEFIAALQQVQRGDGPVSTSFKDSPDLSSEAAGQGSHSPDWAAGMVRDEDGLTRELRMAGKIQADILPEGINLPGWDIAARLEPARETSGDFYDFIPLADRKWGVVIADVSDKGMGAALFMALSSSLVRTYAGRFPTLPAVAMSAVNERLLSDTRSGMFVTTFFGILETHTGRFVFANAGHPPGFLISMERDKEQVQPLRPTGMALGVSDQARWKQKQMRIGPGEVLVLYTDGITEAQNARGEFFGEGRLLDLIFNHPDGSASQIRDALLQEVHRFTGSASRQDDIAVIVIRRQL